MKVKNISGDDRFVPSLGGRLVMAGAVVDVDDAGSFTCQEGVWEAVDKDAKAAHVEWQNTYRPAVVDVVPTETVEV